MDYVITGLLMLTALLLFIDHWKMVTLYNKHILVEMRLDMANETIRRLKAKLEDGVGVADGR